MENIQVEIFCSKEARDLKEDINGFLAGKNVVNIKYQHILRASGAYAFSALIIYKTL